MKPKSRTKYPISAQPHLDFFKLSALKNITKLFKILVLFATKMQKYVYIFINNSKTKKIFNKIN